MLKLSRVNVRFDLYRSVGSLDGVDPVHNNFRVVARRLLGSLESISAAARPFREIGIMRGQVATINYDMIDLDQMAQGGDRVKIVETTFKNTPEGMWLGRWFLVDNGEPTGWTVRAGLNEIPGAAEVGGTTSGPSTGEAGTGTLTEADLVFRVQYESRIAAIPAITPASANMDVYSMDDCYGGLASSHYKVRKLAVIYNGIDGDSGTSNAASTITVSIAGIGGAAAKTYTATVAADESSKTETIDETLSVAENAVVTITGSVAAGATIMPTGVVVRLYTEYVP